MKLHFRIWSDFINFSLSFTSIINNKDKIIFYLNNFIKDYGKNRQKIKFINGTLLKFGYLPNFINPIISSHIIFT